MTNAWSFVGGPEDGNERASSCRETCTCLVRVNGPPRGE